MEELAGGVNRRTGVQETFIFLKILLNSYPPVQKDIGAVRRAA
jgi:hypothetical protein